MVVMHDSYVWFEYFWIIKKYKKIMILFNYIKKILSYEWECEICSLKIK